MPIFPVDISDPQGIVDGVNYALSGPSGLGQNVNSFSTSQPGWLVGANRSPLVRVPVASSEGIGAQGLTTITCFTPTNIFAGLYAFGFGIAAGAQVVSVSGSTVVLSLANTGPVTATVNFYDYPTPDNLNIPNINLATAVQLDAFTVQLTFAVPQPAPPFRVGQVATVSGVSVAGYNRTYTAPGVVECTTTTVTLRAGTDLGTLAAGAGGVVRFQSTVAGPAVGVSTTQNAFFATDLQRSVSFGSITDKMIVSATLDNTFSYTAPAATTLLVRTVLVRSVSFAAQDFQSQAGLLFDQQAIIAEKNYTKVIAGPGTGTESFNTNFGTIVDTPPAAGFYLYRVALQFRNITALGAAQVTNYVLGARTISAQVFKL